MQQVSIALGVAMVLALVPAGTAVPAGSVDQLEPVDDATLGQRSNQTVCEDEITCVRAVLETSHWRCAGTNVSTFACNVTYWLNLTVTGASACASASVNVTEDVAPGACTNGPTPVAHTVGGPATITYNARSSERVVNATSEVCLDTDSGSSCAQWAHDPVLLPSWDEWPGNDPGAGRPYDQHRICLGDSAGATHNGDPGPGCVSGILIADTRCDGRLDDYHCNVIVEMDVTAETGGVCASMRTNYSTGSSAVICNFRHTVLPFRSEEAPEILRTYTSDEIPLDGRIIVIEVEMCAWSFRPDATRYCDTYNETEPLPGDPCACHGGPTDTVRRIVELNRKYLVTTANHTHVPVSAHP